MSMRFQLAYLRNRRKTNFTFLVDEVVIKVEHVDLPCAMWNDSQIDRLSCPDSAKKKKQPKYATVSVTIIRDIRLEIN